MESFIKTMDALEIRLVESEAGKQGKDWLGQLLIYPGGGYRHLSPREAEPIARAFAEYGWKPWILYYSVREEGAPLYDRPLLEGAKAMLTLRERFPNMPVVVCGFSAGAHAALQLGVHWEDSTRFPTAIQKRIRPDACILSYPVVSGGGYAHRGSFENLLGASNQKPAALAYYSLENFVTRNTPPCFLWHTAEDQSVPVENSLLLASALSGEAVPFELHIYPFGPHGMSLATPEVDDTEKGRKSDPHVAEWLSDAAVWLRTICERQKSGTEQTSADGFGWEEPTLPSVTGSQAKEADRIAIEERGIDSLTLMERASRSVTEYVTTHFSGDTKVYILSGMGNNGADGVCIGKQLIRLGYSPVLCLVGSLEKAGYEFLAQLSEYKRLKGELCFYRGESPLFGGAVPLREKGQKGTEEGAKAVLVDAVFGIGLHKEVREPYRRILEEADRLSLYRIAVDVPSGIDADSGALMGAGIHADVTITFGRNKAGLLTGEGREFSGRVFVRDIGIPDEIYAFLLQGGGPRIK